MIIFMEEDSGQITPYNRQKIFHKKKLSEDQGLARHIAICSYYRISNYPNKASYICNCPMNKLHCVLLSSLISFTFHSVVNTSKLQTFP
jgi:hypothetical protein